MSLEKNSVILRAMSRDGGLTALVCDSTAIVGEAIAIHNTAPTASAALGRTLTGASMMGCMLKNEGESLSLQFKGDGAVGTLMAVSDYAGNVRGYAGNPRADLPVNAKGKLDVGGIVGQGAMYVIRQLSQGEPYIGQTEIVSGEIAEDITSYYANSEQVPTVCSLGVLIAPDGSCINAGGILVQLLPFAPEELINALEKSIAQLPSMTDMLSAGMSLEQIMARTLGEIEFDVFDELDVAYKCNCSRERMASALLSVGKSDLEQIISEGKDTELVCHFCNNAHVFTIDEITKWLARQ